MRFSVVANGYDQQQVEGCLTELAVGLLRLAVRAEGAAALAGEWTEVRHEVHRLRVLVDRPVPATAADGRGADLEQQVADLLQQARQELDEARTQARQLREEVYTEAVQARREFEAALHARRQREARVDEILGELTVEEPVPVDTPTAAAAGVPVTEEPGVVPSRPDRVRRRG